MKSRTDRPAEERRVSHRRLSVVIPTWNRARLVCEAVESALGQEGGDLEVIVVDDGSTDGTAEVIERRFGKSVKLLRMATRSGVGAAQRRRTPGHGRSAVVPGFGRPLAPGQVEG